jgi:cytoskeletal protein CcmA (bactofilin family)
MESKEEKPAEAEGTKDGAPAEGAPQPSADQAAPEDALEKTNAELAGDPDVIDATGTTGAIKNEGDDKDKPAKKPNALKALFKRFNVYLLGFVLVMIIAGALFMVSFLNSQKAPKEATINSTKLTQDALKKLASSDATIGNSAQTLTVQGNAVFAGQALVKGDFSSAGNIQSGGTIQAPNLTVSGKSNLADTQINSLQVATNTLVQGTTTLKDLNVSGTSTFSGPVTMGQLTLSRLIMAGNAVLQIPNHISFTGASPTRGSTSQAILGAGGTATINGSDTTGTISINTGSSTSAGCFLNLTFNQKFTNPPHVLISPINAAAGKLDYYATKSQTGFSVCTNNSPDANAVFQFDYFITN